jgi:RNA methyltransferase, TrmH family
MSSDLTSPSNPRIKRLARLRDRAHRDGADVFVTEGTRNLELGIAAGYECLELYHMPYFPDPERFGAAERFTTSERAMASASYRGTPDEVIAVFKRPSNDLDSIVFGAVPLILLLEGIEKPGNLGAILRTADAIGADAVIVADPATDPYNPNVIRASTGAIFSVPVAVAALADAGALLESLGIPLVGLDPSARTTIWDADLSGPVAILVGSEHRGLTPAALELADQLLSIPMGGLTDSLNASISMAIAAFEVVRQRLGSTT